MPLQRRRHQVALYRSLIKVLTLFSPHFDPLFSLIVFPLSPTLFVSLPLPLSLTHFIFILFFQSPCSLALSQTGLAWSSVWTQRRPVKWSPARRWSSTTAAHIKREFSCFPSPTSPPPPPPPCLTRPPPLICSIDGRAQLNLGQWCTDAHNST